MQFIDAILSPCNRWDGGWYQIKVVGGGVWGGLRTRVLEETRLETGDSTREGLGGGWGVSAQPTKVRNEGNSGNRLTWTFTHLPFTPAKSDLEEPSKKWSCGELVKMERVYRAPGVLCVCRVGRISVKAFRALHRMVLHSRPIKRRIVKCKSQWTTRKYLNWSKSVSGYSRGFAVVA